MSDSVRYTESKPKKYFNQDKLDSVVNELIRFNPKSILIASDDLGVLLPTDNYNRPDIFKVWGWMYPHTISSIARGIETRGVEISISKEWIEVVPH